VKANRKRIGIVLAASSLLMLLGIIGLSQAQKGGMHEMGMMGEMMGNMDQMMGQYDQSMHNMDMMMGQQMNPTCMGMANMRGMGMMMQSTSQGMRNMMESMNSMMSNPEMMKDELIQKQMGQMQEHVKIMMEHMQGAMNNWEEMTKRMGEMGSK
jgi:hypothetical protein